VFIEFEKIAQNSSLTFVPFLKRLVRFKHEQYKGDFNYLKGANL
jgi:hypothetical protein